MYKFVNYIKFNSEVMIRLGFNKSAGSSVGKASDSRS